ncbi:Uncharacterised protein [Bergeyella zoohelcum]|uniref:Uncharacterized protein n=2 Tax=Bergeyella zoohelcum TaxID=1015 RepID=A0A7Z8YQV4_9FLAO|nr:Uncharacterised protein [Bergeyella zoohelcum]
MEDIRLMFLLNKKRHYLVPFFYRIIRGTAIIVPLLILQSCMINGNFKGLYSYYESTYESKPELFSKEKWKCTPKDNNIVQIINGKDLEKCLSTSSRSLVYIWGPRCKSDICYSLDAIQKFCDDRKIKLFVVAEYYDLEQMDKNYILKNPILAIDVQYYGTNLTSKYLKLFLKDIHIESFQERYLLYEKGVLKRKIDDLFKDDSLYKEVKL